MSLVWIHRWPVEDSVTQSDRVAIVVQVAPAACDTKLRQENSALVGLLSAQDVRHAGEAGRGIGVVLDPLFIARTL